MTAKQLSIEISLTSQGTRKSARLSGFAFVDSGFLTGHVFDLSGNWRVSEKVLLTALTFTGCPLAAREDQVGGNPWRLTNGSYSGTRDLTGRSFAVKSTIDAQGDEDGVAMELQVEVDGTLPSLSSIASPFQERIQQVELGLLAGQFDVIFLDERKCEHHLQATSAYHLDIQSSVASVWRNILIQSYVTSVGFHQIEQIDLFLDETRAAKDLERKCTVLSPEPVSPPGSIAGVNTGSGVQSCVIE